MRFLALLLLAPILVPESAIADQISLRVGPAFALGDGNPVDLAGPGIQVSTLWSPQATGRSRFVASLGYKRRVGDHRDEGDSQLVPVQAGARFHFGDPTYRSRGVLLELMPGVTYAQVEGVRGDIVCPAGFSCGPPQTVREEHLLFCTTVSATVPVAVSDRFLLELGTGLFWTSSFDAGSQFVPDGLTSFSDWSFHLGMSFLQ